MSQRIESIKQAIASDKKIRIRLYIILQQSEKEINYILESILDKYGKKDDLHMLYTIVKEMATNGVKANLKRIIYDNLNLDFKNTQDYKSGLLSFKEKLREKHVPENMDKLKKADKYVELSFSYNKDVFYIESYNNSAMTQEEEKKIKEKFKASDKYNTIAEFYMDQIEDSEGAGIGIIMTLMLLKENNIDPHNFVIQSDRKNFTKTSLVVPFSRDFIYS